MSDAAAFSGFTKQTVRFYADLGKNNNKPWFEDHRAVYEAHVLAPARLFVTAMGVRLKTVVPGIVAVPAVNKSIFRINRDTRFSLDPSPTRRTWASTSGTAPAPGWSPRASTSGSSRRTSCSAAGCT